MKKFTQIISLFILTTLFNPVWALSAEGFGSSAEEAKKNAYSALSQKILSEVSTEISQVIQDINGTVTQSGEKKIALSSNLILKGVEYQKLDKSFFGEYSATAVLSNEAFKQTLVYFDESTRFDPIGLSQKQHQAMDRLIAMWRAVMQVAPVGSINVAANKQSLETKSYYIDGLKTGAVVKISAQPRKASLFIDGKPQRIDRAIVLSPGEHSFKLVLKNYQPLEKQFFVNKGQSKQFKERLISNSVSQQTMQIRIKDVFEGLIEKESIREMLATYSWQEDPKSIYQFGVLGSYDSSEVGKFIRYQFSFDIGVYKEGKKIKKITYQDRVTVKKSDNMAPKIWKKISKKLNKATHLLAASVNFD